MKLGFGHIHTLVYSLFSVYSPSHMGASPTFFVAKALSSFNYVEIMDNHNSQNSTTQLMQQASSQ